MDSLKYMNTKEWKQIRDRVLERDEHTCQECSSKKNLVVHHSRYDSLFNENMADLITLCESCHKRLHERLKGEIPAESKRGYYNSLKDTLNTITVEELKKIENDLGDSTHALYAKLSFYLCLKPQEIHVLFKEPERINLTEGIIRLNTRSIPIIEPIATEINNIDCKLFKDLTTRAIQIKLNACSKKVLGRAVNMIALRHSGALYYIEEGMPLEALGKFIGHVSFNQTVNYYGSPNKYWEFMKNYWSKVAHNPEKVKE